MTGEASEPDIKTFCDDEDGYLDWVRRNRDGGWVINAGRRFAPSDGLMLHRATCYHITKHGNHTTTGYIKVCSTDREDLVARVRRKAGAEPRPCRICVR